MLLWLIIVLLVVFWSFGYWGPYDTWRTHSALHLIWVLVLILLLVQLLGYGPRGRWGW